MPSRTSENRRVHSRILTIGGIWQVSILMPAASKIYDLLLVIGIKSGRHLEMKANYSYVIFFAELSLCYSGE